MKRDLSKQIQVHLSHKISSLEGESHQQFLGRPVRLLWLVPSYTNTLSEGGRRVCVLITVTDPNLIHMRQKIYIYRYVIGLLSQLIPNQLSFVTNFSTAGLFWPLTRTLSSKISCNIGNNLDWIRPVCLIAVL